MPPTLKISTGIGGASRWCTVAFPPKGDENVEELYKEIHDIILEDSIMDYAGEYNGIVIETTRGFQEKDNYPINISDPQNLVTDEEKEAFKYY